jgi:chromatin remodeling complex protein RSC6
MKYATKLMVVPFVNLQNPKDKQLSDLDTKMSDILQNNKISIDDKVKIYKKTLDSFMLAYEKINPTEINPRINKFRSKRRY